MSMAEFREVFRCGGMDETASGMIIAVGKQNLFALSDGAGFSVTSANKSAVSVDEINHPGAILAVRDAIRQLLSLSFVDRKVAIGLMPDVIHGPNARYFLVKAHLPLNTFIDAKPPNSAQKPLRLRVISAGVKPIDLAIVNLQVPNTAGAWVNQATRPSVPDVDLASINSVWTPQTNIKFNLAAAPPVRIDDRDVDTQKEFQDAFDLRPDTIMQFAKVDPEKMQDILKRRIKSSADFTIIVAKAIQSGADGHTVGPRAFAVVADNRDITSMAHETGHFIGGHVDKKKGHWEDQHDLDSTDSSNLRLLMRGNGAGFKIPFDFAMHCRDFPSKAKQ
jgi:hypothetical protein